MKASIKLNNPLLSTMISLVVLMLLILAQASYAEKQTPPGQLGSVTGAVLINAIITEPREATFERLVSFNVRNVSKDSTDAVGFITAQATKNIPLHFHVEVDCLNVKGQGAWMSGKLSGRSFDFEFEDLPIALYVIDSDQPASMKLDVALRSFGTRSEIIPCSIFPYVNPDADINPVSIMEDLKVLIPDEATPDLEPGYFDGVIKVGQINVTESK